MGAEALCRGAALVVGIEQSGHACQVIQQNWQQVAQDSQLFRVIRGNVTHRLSDLTGQQFDRIYFDPPYASELYEPTLAAIVAYHLLAPGGELAVEHSPDRTLAPPPAALEAYRQKVYGNTALTFYRPYLHSYPTQTD
jgi:16S rRNA (guanine(966)-N(2))-methyltransferase RsmD